MIAFVVVYGLDWVATVPPTVALCREAFGEQGTIVFGWVFAAHQLGAAVMSVVAGVVRDSYRRLQPRLAQRRRDVRRRRRTVVRGPAVAGRLAERHTRSLSRTVSPPVEPNSPPAR